MPRLAVVILTWNGRDDTLACLDSLRPELGADDAAILCDNGSADGTQAAVRARHPWVRLQENGANLGFAGGNNPGISRALDGGFAWVLLLNNDTLVPPGTIAGLLAHAASRPGVAAFQPLLVSTDGARIDSAGQALFRCIAAADDLRGRPVADAPREPAAIFGACAAGALVRADALREVGLFDEGYFVLFEDVDLMLRLRAAGHGVELVPSLRIVHKRGVSGSGDKKSSTWPRTLRLWTYRNLVALALRWWPASALLANAPRFLVLTWRALRASTDEERCLPLWRRHLAARRASRRAMRRHGVDVWFRRGAPGVPPRD